MKNVLLIALSLVMIVSCTDPKAEKVKALQDEAIAIHDEVMPRIGEINELAIKVKKSIPADTMDSLAVIEADRALGLVRQLDDAHNAMMDWMAAYDPNVATSAEADSAIAYYERQKVEITDVKHQMEKSIEDANDWLEKQKSSR